MSPMQPQNEGDNYMMDGFLEIDTVSMLDTFTDTLRLIGERYNSLIPVTKGRRHYLGWDSSFILIIDKRSDYFINLRFQRPIEVGRSRPAIDEEICTCDESAFVAHQQFRRIGHLIRCTGTPGRTLCKHIFVEIPAGAVKFVDGQRRNNGTGGDGIDPSALYTPFDRLAITRFSLHRLASW